jgi:hypothetical protein
MATRLPAGKLPFWLTVSYIRLGQYSVVLLRLLRVTYYTGGVSTLEWFGRYAWTSETLPPHLRRPVPLLALEA